MNGDAGEVVALVVESWVNSHLADRLEDKEIAFVGKWSGMRAQLRVDTICGALMDRVPWAWVFSEW